MPSALNALTGLAALEAKEKATQRTLEMILYILQHPASARETQDLATRLQLELESKLPPAQVEAAEQNIGLKSLEEFVQPFLTSFGSR